MESTKTAKRRRRTKVTVEKTDQKKRNETNEEGTWFVCLFASIKWVSLDQFKSINLNEAEDQRVKKKSSKKSKTFISVTMNPEGTLSSLRNGTIPPPGMKRDARSKLEETAAELTSNMEIACLVGPLESKESSLAFRRLWESRSRGLVSRSATGRVLARQYGYRCSINWNAFYKLNRRDVHIQEETDANGDVDSLVFTIIKTL